VQFDALPKGILELELGKGIGGVGELDGEHDWGKVESIARRLIGMQLADLPRQQLPIAPCREYDGFECAIWDAFAKQHNLRLVDLLGGQVHSQIRIGAW